MDYKYVQQIARETMDYARHVIEPGMNLQELRNLCENKMFELGADSFWYWGVGAFVFSGDETILSISGRNYITSNRTIQNDDIITIDLSPQCGDTWGDYARTIILEDGMAVELNSIKNVTWKQGLMMEEFLHAELIRFARPETTFEELYIYMNDIIRSHGFVNLDFIGNLGHSIVRRKEDRIYIEKGNTHQLSEAAYFTFEPHISTASSVYGFKKENIYYFDEGNLKKL